MFISEVNYNPWNSIAGERAERPVKSRMWREIINQKMYLLQLWWYSSDPDYSNSDKCDKMNHVT